ncbi:MAG: acyltransferase [Pseudomonadota bacterium]
MTATPVTTAAKASPDARMDVLDGMRGFAALAVVFFHFFSRWAEPHFTPTLYQHGAALAEFFPIQVGGAFGVRLFFLISGFVIMMTLERSTGLIDFAVRRSARLWPTMLVCATLSTLIINGSGIAHIYENVARYEVTAVEYWSSIFFIPPDLTAGVLGIEQADRPRWVEGVYWTLWAEVRFYALIALAYWLSPRGAFLWVWAGLQVASTVLDIAMQATGGFNGGTAAGMVLQPDILGWFTLGLVAWKARTLGAHPALLLASGAAIIALLVGPIVSISGVAVGLTDRVLREGVLMVAIATPFVLFLRGSRLVAPLAWNPMVTIGLASYPLYLFHERPGMAYLHWLNSAGVPPWVAVFIAIGIAIATAILIHKLVEMPGKRVMLKGLMPGAAGLQSRIPALRMAANKP